jgi:CBS domain-containing protein
MSTCQEVITRDPVSCLRSDTVHVAAALMKEQDVGSIPVVENRENNRLAGIITDRDLTVKVLAEGRDANSTKLEEVMTRHPVTCAPGDDLQKAFEAMTSNRVRRIPVVDQENRLVGIIAQADVATRTEATAKVAELVEKVSHSPTAEV